MDQSYLKEVPGLIAKAESIYRDNFPAVSRFERAIFFSWGCSIGDCTFCYMSTQPEGKKPTETKRSKESILAEFVLAKHLGWDIGFFTGGIGVFNSEEIESLLQDINLILGEKIWLSVGPISKSLLEKYKPYIKGVVGSTETINSELHDKVCPSKPLAPYEKMFEWAKELDLERAMTFIVGMGEQASDLDLLKKFIDKYKINKIHIYGLIPREGTIFQHASIPTTEEQAWWIANLRIAFPRLDIQCGIWEDRVDRISVLLQAGSNTVSKFKATKLFGTTIAKEIEHQVELSDRTFEGTLTKLPDIDWNEIIDSINLDKNTKEGIKQKLFLYINRMKKNITQSQP
jgi:biotin synthase-like enzyme